MLYVCIVDIHREQKIKATCFIEETINWEKKKTVIAGQILYNS